MMEEARSRVEPNNFVPHPKPRKHPHLWQAYLAWQEMVGIKGRHTRRAKASERGASNLDSQWESDFLEALAVDTLIGNFLEEMVGYARLWDPPFSWLVEQKGIGDSLAAQLLAHIDDFSTSPTVSALWRFSGHSVAGGRAEFGKGPDGRRNYNARLKSTVWQIGEQFIRHQSPPWADMYYAEKERLRRLHPEPEEIPDAKKGTWPRRFTDNHIHRMAIRKVRKEFLKQLWTIATSHD